VDAAPPCRAAERWAAVRWLLVAASKLAARKQLDRATRDDAAKGWKTRFVKEQVGFGNTWRQQ